MPEWFYNTSRRLSRTSSEHPLKLNSRQNDLEGANLIPPDNTLLLRQILDSTLYRSGGHVNPVIETNPSGLIWPLVTWDVGISVVSGHEDRRVDQDSVRYVKIANWVLLDGLIAYCTLAGRNLSKAAEAFIDSFLPVFEDFVFWRILKTLPILNINGRYLKVKNRTLFHLPFHPRPAWNINNTNDLSWYVL